MADVSREMGIQDRACKRWERGGARDAFPPEDAWSVLEDYESMRAPLAAAIAECAEVDERNHVYLPYFHSQPEYDERPLPEAEGQHLAFTFANTCLRDAGSLLEQKGLEVDFLFPNEGQDDQGGPLPACGSDSAHVRLDREPDYCDR